MPPRLPHDHRETILDMRLNTRQRRMLREIAHHLDPVVAVGNGGASPAVLSELNRALTDHELIKVRIHGEDREQRQAAIAALIEGSQAEAVQTIGKIVVLYRPNPEPDPQLSNILRAGIKLR